MKNILIYFSALLVLLLSCNTVEPPPDGNTPVINLSVEDVSCTEAWINLKTENIPLSFEAILNSDSIVVPLTISSKDTVLYTDLLLPNKTYNFKFTIQKQSSNIQYPETSIQLTTLDTTSHNFTWQTFEFGEHGNSILRDVAIIDENNIWAVGEIRIADTSVNGYKRYSYMKWNGTEWKPGMLKYFPPGSLGDSLTTSGYSIFALNEDVWISGGAIFHWDNANWQIFYNTGAEGANRIWGTSNNNLYAAGNNGNIAHYNGSQWTKMESGTSINLHDIWGSPDKTVWACGYTSDFSKTVLLRYDGINWNTVYEGSTNQQNNNLFIGPLSGGWTNSKFFTYLLNWGALYKQDNKNNLDLSALSKPFFYDVGFAISANDKNDIFIAGESGMYGHFNGVRFYDLSDLRKNNMQYLGSDAKSNLFVTVGWDYSSILTKAIITIGRKN